MSRAPRPRAARVGLFGLLGSGNIGNDISMQSVLATCEARSPTRR